MPIHDWTRVSAEIWHCVHLSWVAELQKVFNEQLLPAEYYAQVERIAGLHKLDREKLIVLPDADAGRGTVSVIADPPQTRFTAEAEMDDYALKRRTIVIRHSSGDDIVALLEIVSPGNKSSWHAIRSFVEKAVEALYRGYHLLIVDLFPPGPRDPQGIHAAIWREISDELFTLPPDEPLTLAAYSSGQRKIGYIEPTAVGKTLIDMPLFLFEGGHILVPFEATYQAAYQGVPRKWREVLEAPSGS